jgi:AcrR family transcriptional regulator
MGAKSEYNHCEQVHKNKRRGNGMPKIIEDLERKLLLETRRQIDENGYSALTVRSVAKAVGVGVGTVYNYFPSKDMMLAHLLLTDWHIILKQIEEESKNTDLEGALLCIYKGLKKFANKYQQLFSDSDAKKSYSFSSSDKHRLLRHQLSLLILPKCNEKAEDEMFYADFIIEAMLTWTMEDKSFESIIKALKL